MNKALAKLLGEIQNVAPETFSAAQTVEEAQIDSLTIVEIAMASERVFGKAINERDLNAVGTLGEMSALIESSTVA